jgi:hypothetical protein
MFRALKADKDTYITNKYIDGRPAVSGNVGIAGTLDFFKLYGITIVTSGSDKIPKTELSRALIHFDLEPLQNLVSNGRVDLSHNSFKCLLSLKDVYGGQPTPNNFTIDIFPLSASFTEGYGKDVAYYSDEDKCNFLSSSSDALWFGEGCTKACFSTGSGDYITSSVTIADTKVSQTFVKGTEDLLVDVTKIISATIKGDLPDSGFRLSYSSAAEDDNKTYFVKRFASRHAYDESKHPKLLIKFDDSIQDDTSNLFLDSPVSASLFLYNYIHGQLTNLTSGSTFLTGSNSVLLELQTEVTGVGTYSLFFTGSQHKVGSNYTTGIYSASVTIPFSDATIKKAYDLSGSVSFTPIWSSIDKNVAFATGSIITARPPERISYRLNPRRYTVNVTGITTDYSQEEEVTMRVYIFDQNDPIIFAKRLPAEIPGLSLRNVHYAIRNAATNEYAIPFDTTYNSTKLSSDSKGMYFNFNTSTLTSLNSYVVDIMINVDNLEQKYLNASSQFRIINL